MYRRQLLAAAPALVLIAGTISAVAQDSGRAPYASSDYRSIVPTGWTLLPSSATPNERRFVSPSGDAWLSLYAQPTNRTAMPAELEVIREADGGRITYQREEKTWLVVSGFKGDRIFYRKAMLACGGREWHQLSFEYPAAEKRAYDRFVTRASYALGAYERIGCHG